MGQKGTGLFTDPLTGSSKTLVCLVALIVAPLDEEGYLLEMNATH